MSGENPSDIRAVDDPYVIIEALRDMLTQTLHAFAALDENRASSCIENVWARIDRKLTERGASENDRLCVRSLIDRAEARSNIIERLERPL